MRRAPRKLASEAELYTAALRALMRRAHSVHEMRLALERRAADRAAVRRVLERLKAERLLDDDRYARQFARQRAETRRQGRYRIARELRARGVPERHIEAALEEILTEVDEVAMVRRRIARKLRQLGGPLDERKLAALYRSLLRAGFSADRVRQQLRTLAKHDVEDLAEPSQDHED